MKIHIVIVSFCPSKVFEKEEGRKNLVRNIIYSSPRILRKNVECQLKPAVDFLNNLYGYDMFIKVCVTETSLLNYKLRNISLTTAEKSLYS